jgi:1-deoxy-D-xylulose-5-phosphate synthase
VLNLGLPDRFIDHGSRSEMLHDAGLDAEAILAQVLERLGSDVEAKLSVAAGVVG